MPVPETVLDLAERLWNGEVVAEHHPVSRNFGELVEVGEGSAFIPSFANVSAFSTEGGLVLVDTGSFALATDVHQRVRQWNDQRLDTAVYSHGHVDHVFGVPVFEAESNERGWPAPTVIAHEALPHRFDRYKMTAGYNGIINQRQFQFREPHWPVDYRYPDLTYRDTHTVVVGDTTFELHHCRSETDDQTWTWIPERKVLCCGDMFIWASPNAGNPQKVQRYPREWAMGLRQMVELDAEVLLPGHGVPIVGADRIRQALSDCAELLETLHDETVALMNQGARLDEIVHTVKAPSHLIEKPYLRPVYDEPEFVVRNVWRLYGGWWDGNPATLKPAPEATLAGELAALVGGATRLADRARELVESGDLRLGCALAELASLAAPDDPGVHASRAEVYRARTEAETSTMAKGVYAWAARESEQRATGT